MVGQGPQESNVRLLTFTILSGESGRIKGLPLLRPEVFSATQMP